MTVAITRTDRTAKDLREASKGCDEPAVVRRLLAIALLLEGATREDAARQCGMDRQTLRDWVHRYNAEGIAGLSNRPRGGGACSRLTAEQQAELAEWVRTGPDPEKDGVVRWRRVDLQAKIATKFNVKLHERSVGKLLRRLGFSRISVRPPHPQADVSEQEAHKKLRGAGRGGGSCRKARPADRTVVAGRGPRRSTGQPDLHLGRAWQPPDGAARSAL